MQNQHFDVLIVGAGISGICSAYYLQQRCRDKSFAILEARNRVGGTWDLFNYPGLRCDNSIYTYAFSFMPWQGGKVYASGESIRRYIEETVSTYAIDKNIRFGHRITGASWSSVDAKWTVQVENLVNKTKAEYTCNFLNMCSGYYNYETGYDPKFVGSENYGGRIVHPQNWNENVEYAEKKVIIIGSGATAVTLAPALANSARQVTILQRSPTYIVPVANYIKIIDQMYQYLPKHLAYFLSRAFMNYRATKWINFCRREPVRAREFILSLIRKSLGSNYDIDTHFSPRYKVWDERLCTAPDADLFRGIKSGKITMVTDKIETFTKTGLKLQSGKELEADLIITATGLEIKVLAGIPVFVDGRRIDFAKTLTYKDILIEGVPNFARTAGSYYNTWTPKAEAVGQFICRLLNHMKRKGYDTCAPYNDDPNVTQLPIPLKSGYVQRAHHMMLKEGSVKPWKNPTNNIEEFFALKTASLQDGILRFSKSTKTAVRQADRLTA